MVESHGVKLVGARAHGRGALPLSEVSDDLFDLCPVAVGDTPTEVEVLLVVGDGLLPLTSVLQEERPVEVGVREVGLEADGLAVAADLLLGIAGPYPSLEPLLGAQFFLPHRW